MPKPAVIIDNGSSFIRAGFAGQKKPKFVLRTMSLHPCSAGTAWETQQHLTTTESTAGFTVAPRTYPLKHGIIEDWDGMENLWSHLFFCGLKVLPEEQPLGLWPTPLLVPPPTEKSWQRCFLRASGCQPCTWLTPGFSPSAPMAE